MFSLKSGNIKIFSNNHARRGQVEACLRIDAAHMPYIFFLINFATKRAMTRVLRVLNLSTPRFSVNLQYPQAVRGFGVSNVI